MFIRLLKLTGAEHRLLTSQLSCTKFCASHPSHEFSMYACLSTRYDSIYCPPSVTLQGTLQITGNRGNHGATRVIANKNLGTVQEVGTTYMSSIMPQTVTLQLSCHICFKNGFYGGNLRNHLKSHGMTELLCYRETSLTDESVYRLRNQGKTRKRISEIG